MLSSMHVYVYVCHCFYISTLSRHYFYTSTVSHHCCTHQHCLITCSTYQHCLVTTSRYQHCLVTTSTHQHCRPLDYSTGNVPGIIGVFWRVSRCVIGPPAGTTQFTCLSCSIYCNCNSRVTCQHCQPFEILNVHANHYAGFCLFFFVHCNFFESNVYMYNDSGFERAKNIRPGLPSLEPDSSSSKNRLRWRNCQKIATTRYRHEKPKTQSGLIFLQKFSAVPTLRVGCTNVTEV